MTERSIPASSRRRVQLYARGLVTLAKDKLGTEAFTFQLGSESS